MSKLLHRRTLSGALAMTVVATLALGTVGCGGTKANAKTANVKPGSMPSGADWDGVYYSPLFGYLHIESSGNLIEGRWERPRKGEWGELQGNADGNLLKFDWSEYITGLVGPNSKKTGKGYFLYRRPEGENVDDVIEGEIGHGEDEVGTPWEAIKQRNVEADIKSIGGSGATDVGGGDWDTDNKESGEPEEPTSPDDDEDAPEL